MRFNADIDVDAKYLKDKFFDDETFIMEDIYLADTSIVLCKFCYINGVSDPDKIAEMVIKPLKKYQSKIVDKYIISANMTFENDIEKAIRKMLEGDCIILIPNYSQALVVDTKNNIFRSIDEPTNEKVLKGPKDGFIENILVNTALVRRHAKNDQLKIKFYNFNGLDHNRIAIMYIKNKVNKKVLEIMERRISSLNSIESLDTNVLKENIKDNPYSPLKTVGDTERPDVVAYHILEGRVGIIMDGTPVALIVPYLFHDNFQNMDDYYLNFYYASVNRMLRFVSFIISISAPALYVAFLNFHRELLPTKILMSISASREGVPFPTLVEVFILLTMFELLRETGSKIPNVLGSALSIVGALIIGQATVDARIVSTSVVVVVAVSAVTGLISPRLSGPVVIFRIFLLLCSALVGIQGFISGLILIAIFIMRMESFGINYVSHLFSFDLKRIKSTYVRLPHKRR